MHHTVVISDIHLCEVERSDGLWMRYRQASYGPDTEIASMLTALRARVAGERLTLVLNGDVFDFDAPRVIGGESVFHDLPRDAAHTVPMLAAILDDHPVFVRALGEVLADGHQVVFLAGNHDVQLTIPEVSAVLVERLVEATCAVLAERGEGAPPRAGVEARVLVRPWFHRTEDDIVIEHGHQYDPYCSNRYPLSPFRPGEGAIQPTMGSLAARHLTSRMGFFNPHVDDSFMLTTAGYAKHWAECYLFSKHSLAVSWFVGALRTVAELVRVRQRHDRRRLRDDIKQAARQTGVTLLRVARHARLFAQPAEERLMMVLRELWLDRVALLALCAVMALAWLLWSWVASAVALVAGVAVFALYERYMPKPPLDETWQAVQRAARKVARIHRAAAVVFGHTHKAEGSWEGGVFVGNSGSWSAAYRDIACQVPVEATRPLVWLRSVGGRLSGGLVRFRDGVFEGAFAGAGEPAGQLERRSANSPSVLCVGRGGAARPARYQARKA